MNFGQAIVLNQTLNRLAARADAARRDIRRSACAAAAQGAVVHVLNASNDRLRERLADAQEELAALRAALAEAEADRDAALGWIMKHAPERLDA